MRHDERRLNIIRLCNNRNDIDSKNYSINVPITPLFEFISDGNIFEEPGCFVSTLATASIQLSLECRLNKRRSHHEIVAMISLIYSRFHTFISHSIFSNGTTEVLHHAIASLTGPHLPPAIAFKLKAR
jgi:uncharacterized membrane protein